jgi:hypothetical protein
MEALDSRELLVDAIARTACADLRLERGSRSTTRRAASAAAETYRNMRRARDRLVDLQSCARRRATRR